MNTRKLDIRKSSHGNAINLITFSLRARANRRTRKHRLPAKPAPFQRSQRSRFARKCIIVDNTATLVTTSALVFNKIKTAPTPCCVTLLEFAYKKRISILISVYLIAHKTSAASRPAATPPTVPSTFPAAFPFADALGLAMDEVLVAEEVAAAELEVVPVGTLVGWRVPHVVQDLEPGFVVRQSANN